MAVPATALMAALLALLLLALASRVSQLRMRHKISLGDGGNPALLRAVRAHGNTAEHAPIFLVMALAYELGRGADLLLVATGAAFVLGRFVYAAGLLGRGLHVLRLFGAFVTYLGHLVLAAALIVAVAA